MTPEEKKALTAFIVSVTSWADLTRHHLRTTMSEKDYDAHNELNGAHHDLHEARDTLWALLL